MRPGKQRIPVDQRKECLRCDARRAVLQGHEATPGVGEAARRVGGLDALHLRVPQVLVERAALDLPRIGQQRCKVSLVARALGGERVGQGGGFPPTVQCFRTLSPGATRNARGVVVEAVAKRKVASHIYRPCFSSCSSSCSRRAVLSACLNSYTLRLVAPKRVNWADSWLKSMRL